VALAEGEEDPLWNRPSFEKKVFLVAQRILTANGIPDRIQFLTSQRDIRNAYASRFGGPNTVVIFKDMLDVMESDDELAAVLSHEIAHITKRHTGKIVPKRWAAKTALWTAYTVGGTAASVATAGLAAPVFIVGAAGIKKMHRNGIALTDPISRPYEKEADLVGLEYMTKAGYNPLAMESLLLKGAADSGPVANFFSSHPGGSERLAYIHEAIQSHYPQYLTEESASASPVDRSGEHSGSPEEAASSGDRLKPSKSSKDSELSPVSLPPGTKDHQPAPQTDKASNLAQAGPGQPMPPAFGQSQKQGGKSVSGESQQQSTTSSSELGQSPSVQKEQVGKNQTTLQARTAAASVSSSKASAAVTSVSVASSSPSTAKALFAKPVAASIGSTQNERSVAQVLLSLQPDQLRVLRMLSQRGYLSRAELRTQLDYVAPELLTQQLNELIQKRLIRLLGAEPDEVIVLTDWAAEAFKPESAR
jgi:hypothetical protein